MLIDTAEVAGATTGAGAAGAVLEAVAGAGGGASSLLPLQAKMAASRVHAAAMRSTFVTFDRMRHLVGRDDASCRRSAEKIESPQRRGDLAHAVGAPELQKVSPGEKPTQARRDQPRAGPRASAADATAWPAKMG
jgi:hypothetical protein